MSTANDSANRPSLHEPSRSYAKWAGTSPFSGASIDWRSATAITSLISCSTNRRLKCLVALELKIGAFLPEYVGKMQCYLAALDDLVRMANENPSIGMILCTSKDKTIIEYALRASNKPIDVATYRIVTTLPTEL